MMSEETNVQCPACTAELPPQTIECPWCGHLLTPSTEEKQPEETLQPQEQILAPEPQPSEPAESNKPEAVFTVAEPGLTEISPVPSRAPASNLKVMGIILIIFSIFALAYFLAQVIKGNLPQLVLVVPIFGMIIGLISVAVGQKR
jgi:hypothetical protein